MNVYTIKMLKERIQELEKEGIINDNTPVIISDDEEGNGYHYAWYSEEVEKEELPEVLEEKIMSEENHFLIG